MSHQHSPKHSPKHKVPRLVLSDSAIDSVKQPPSQSSPAHSPSSYIDLHTQIQVLCGKISEMQSEQDLEKLHAIYDAKKSLASRTDITYYITADDLIKVQHTNAKVYLRLCPDAPQTARKFKSSSSPSVSPSRRADNGSDNADAYGAKRNGSDNADAYGAKRNGSDNADAYGAKRNGNNSLYIRKESKRSNSVDTVRKDSVNSTSSLTPSPKGSRQKIKHSSAQSRILLLRSGSFIISYEKLTEPVSCGKYFAVVERDAKKHLTCKILSDSQLRSDVIMRYDCYTINNTNSKLVITMYSPDIHNAEFPMYFQINNDITVENFIDMIPDLISESQEKYKPSELETTLREALAAMVV